MHDQVAVVRRVGGQGETDPERGGQRGPLRVGVHELHLRAREAGQHGGDARADHARADHGDPVADQRRGVPERVDGGLDGAGEHGSCGRHALRNDGDRAGRDHVGGAGDHEHDVETAHGRTSSPSRRRTSCNAIVICAR